MSDEVKAMLRREGMDGCIEFKNVEVTRMFFFYVWSLSVDKNYQQN